MSSPEQDDLVFKALADSRRRRILDLLKSSARTTGELCREFEDLDRCTVMQHIGVLEKAELILSQREGRKRWNYLNALPIKEIHDRWISPYAASALQRLVRLKRDLEGSGVGPDGLGAEPRRGSGRKSTRRTRRSRRAAGTRD